MSRASLPYIVRRAALAGLAIGALVAGLAATSAAITGYAQAGVFSELPGGVVLSVSPTGHAWRAGIRAGQVVDALDSEDAPTGWRIETHDPRGRYTATGVGANETLRLSLPLALTGLGAACLAVLFLRTRRRWVMPAAAVGLLAASVPLLYEGGADMSTVVLAGAATVPGVALSVHLSGGWQLRVPVIAAIVGGAIAWAVARLGGWDAFPGFEDARGNLALWGTLLLVLDRTLVPAFAGERLHVTRPRLADVAMITGLAVVALTLMLVKAPPFVVALLLALALVSLSVTRRRFAGPIGAAFLGDVREAAAADAAEAERARLARELHDVPLQELAGVIRRLEILPGAEAESDKLRLVAGHLRNVATELRPPVLDDLGLGAALDYLAEESSTASFQVTAEVTDATGFGPGQRPPADVELAIFRIAGEAVGNAVRHSGGTKAGIVADVRPHRVDLAIGDDGGGLEAGAAQEAARRKRLGLASMRRRAEAVDAELSIESSTRGTEVRLAWRA